MREGLSHEEVRELLGASVVGALTDRHEQEAVAEHLRECQTCRAERDELKEAAERLRDERAEWDVAAEAVWERIRTEIRRRPGDSAPA
ncbi:MAG: hypothetical protein M3144_08290 [Actinomycetota bacterium]|nr:hypothetical protein [Actinomycetota bacterium]